MYLCVTLYVHVNLVFYFFRFLLSFSSAKPVIKKTMFILQEIVSAFPHEGKRSKKLVYLSIRPCVVESVPLLCGYIGESGMIRIMIYTMESPNNGHIEASHFILLIVGKLSSKNTLVQWEREHLRLLRSVPFREVISIVSFIQSVHCCLFF